MFTSMCHELRLAHVHHVYPLESGSKQCVRRVAPSSFCSLASTMPTHLTTHEQALLDQLVRARKPASHARARINRLRAARGISPISLCTVRRFFRGTTHRRGLKERRGRPSLLRPKDVKSLEQARLRLLKEAAKPGKKRRVTHDDVQQEAGLRDR